MTDAELLAIRAIKEHRTRTLATIVKKCREMGVEPSDVDRVVDEAPAFLPDAFVKRWRAARRDANEPPTPTEPPKRAESTPKKKITRRRRADVEKEKRILAYWDARPGARLREIAKATGASAKFVGAALKRERGRVPSLRRSYAEKRADALAFYERNPGATLREAARALGNRGKPSEYFRGLGEGPWTGELETNKRLAKRYKRGVDDDVEERFVVEVFNPAEANRPFLDPAYRAALPQGYDGFNYVGEYWDRYRTCFQCHRDGGRYTAESNRITFHDSERKERARPRENELGFLW